MVNNNYWISYWRIKNTTINIEIRLIWLNKTKIANKNCFRSRQQQYIKAPTLVKINNFHQLKKSTFSIVLKPLKNFERYGTVELENDIITHFFEKKKVAEGIINGGTYLINKDVFLTIIYI